MATHSLDGSSSRVDLGDGFALVIPSVVGVVTDTAPAEPGTRAFASTRGFAEESFDAQLESAGLERTRIIDLEGSLAGAPPGGGARELAEEPPTVGALQVPREPGMGAVVLVEGESGALSWVVPSEGGGRTRDLGLAATDGVLTFEIPLVPAATGSRGIGGLFRKVLRVFRYPVERVEEAVGDIVAGFIRRWERRHRPYVVRSYAPDDYLSPRHGDHALSPRDWERLAAGRALLFVHGTFSSCEAFCGITAGVMSELGRRYGGRMFAFNHPTMADDPTQNAAQLLAGRPAAAPPLTIDIVCHSRGGLVAREIARLGRDHGVRVERIVMVGVPNGGTALADGEHMLRLLDRLTTVSKVFPGRAATVAVDAIVAAVKVLAHAMLDDMTGLAAMNPAGDFLRALNAMPADAGELYAIASNYEPPPGTPLFSISRVKDAGADVAFGQSANDLVVPTEGAYAVAAAGFPVPEERRFLFDSNAGVVHTEYFGQPATLARLTDWLNPDAARGLVAVRERGLSPGDVDALRAHVVNLSNGAFSRRGSFTTTREDVDRIFERDLPSWSAAQPAGSPCRVMLWAHGGLINERDGLAIAHKHVAWWKSNGVYPLYFIWETGLFDALGSLLSSAGRTSRAVGARGFTDFSDHLVEKVCRRLRGDLVWGAMKTNAERCSAADGGAAYVAARLKDFCADHDGVELHAAGHSAGSIFHSHLLPAAKKLGVPPFATLQLLAPAIRVDAFKQRLLPLLGKQVKALTMYSMSDDYERRDSCLGIYRRSLLYLIHHALEEEEQVPILGLEIAARNDPELSALFRTDGPYAARATAVWSVTGDGASDDASRSTSHGGFDDDAATMTSVAARVLGSVGGDRLRPYVGDARRGREWPLSPEIASAIARPGADADPQTAAEPSVAARPEPTTTGHAGRRLALCIGIDRYPGGNALFGCVNDARSWKRLLEETLHFDRVDTLTDEKATREGIANAVRSLLADAAPGDTVVLQYAGHGTSLPDPDGDESDGVDEVLVPVDFESGQFITDDDIRSFLTSELKAGVSLTVFLDCCHSGTITRMLGRTAPEPLPGVRARFMRLDADHPAVKGHLALRARERRSDGGRRLADSSELRWVNFSACDATEKAYEQNGSGDFTRYATALLRGGVDMTNLEFQRRVVREFGEQRRQTPQLDCPLDAEGEHLLRFVARGADAPAPSAASTDRRGAADRRAAATTAPAYDRRSGTDRRHSETADALRDLADRIESWSMDR